MITDTVFALALGGLAAIYGAWAVASYIRFRGTRAVVCPETQRGVAVEVDASRAAVDAAMGRRGLHLASCSRWPERGDCGQECLAQIEQAPHDCLVRTILIKWYAGRRCYICGRRIGDIGRIGPKPGLISLVDPDHRIVRWHEIPAATLLETLSSHAPVCPNCQVVETFRRHQSGLEVEGRPDA
jgi:hypothetical protein